MPYIDTSHWHAFAEHPEPSQVSCEEAGGRNPPPGWQDMTWEDAASEVEAELREMLRHAEQAAGECYD
ncbi:hypothetical protein [Pyxidicoccus xibeiensis]|uniref:hypothetical protein n=1 Tax=Pyxidicoccus xibeiensis TaxID=2906759 RepID=UPI0020A76083|nr:hypothetical protein [Pyxidicoccus xibeiensis]MCP3142338.1 hypothetical protein [Pyxidicoccus xibeiensis]